jgi:hypothetical protein
MLDVFFTVDVEVWCDGWDDLDRQFPAAFDRYIYGKTPRGDYGLPYTLRTLHDHGLLGVFFVEPLFATRFGTNPLAEVVALVQQHAQEVQLHLHTEWVDEAKDPLVSNVNGKRQLLRYFSLEEQTALLGAGLRLLSQAGANPANAFRAGNFGFNRDTLRALAANGISFDSSYNAVMYGPDSGVATGTILVEPIRCEETYEYPMTVFHDGTSRLRMAQVTACSTSELEGLLWRALKAERKAFVILSHNFELLNQAKDRPDDVAVKRFQALCRFLDRHRDCFRVRGFRDLEPRVASTQPPPLKSPLWKTGFRMLEQAGRRRYG